MICYSNIPLKSKFEKNKTCNKKKSISTCFLQTKVLFYKLRVNICLQKKEIFLFYIYSLKIVTGLYNEELKVTQDTALYLILRIA